MVCCPAHLVTMVTVSLSRCYSNLSHPHVIHLVGATLLSEPASIILVSGRGLLVVYNVITSVRLPHSKLSSCPLMSFGS